MAPAIHLSGISRWPFKSDRPLTSGTPLFKRTMRPPAPGHLGCGNSRMVPILGDSRLAEWIKTGLFQQACCGLKQRGLATWPRRMARSIRKSWRDGLTNKHGYLCITMMKDTCISCDITPYHTPNSNVNRPPSPAFRGTIVTKFRVVTNQIPWFSQRKWHQPPSLVDSWVEKPAFLRDQLGSQSNCPFFTNRCISWKDWQVGFWKTYWLVDI